MKHLILALSLILTSCGINNRSATPREYFQELQGEWLTACFYFNSAYRQQSMKYVGYQVLFREIVYSDSSCLTPLVNYELKANYSLGTNRDMVIDSSIEFMTSIIEVKATVVDSATVASYNATSSCGYNDWSLNSAKDVSGRVCEAGDKSQPNIGQQYMNLIGIYPINTLHLGNDRCTLDSTCVTYYGVTYPREFYPWTFLKQ